MYVCLFTCLHACLSVCPLETCFTAQNGACTTPSLDLRKCPQSLCMPVYQRLLAYLSTCLPACLSVCLSACRLAGQPLCLPAGLPVCLSARLPVCLSAWNRHRTGPALRQAVTCIGVDDLSLCLSVRLATCLIPLSLT